MTRDSCFVIREKRKIRVAVVGGSLYSECRADGKSIVSLTVLMLGRPGRKKKTEGLQYLYVPFAEGNFFLRHLPGSSGERLTPRRQQDDPVRRLLFDLKSRYPGRGDGKRCDRVERQWLCRRDMPRLHAGFCVRRWDGQTGLSGA